MVQCRLRYSRVKVSDFTDIKVSGRNYSWITGVWFGKDKDLNIWFKSKLRLSYS